MSTILVTGANRGIGLEVCRQLAQVGHHVILSARSREKGEAAVAGLAREKLNVEFLELDVSREESIRTAAEELKQRHRALHVLINNAAILPTWGGTILDLTPAELNEVFNCNVLGPLLLTQALVPLLEAGKPARVLNVSSLLGSLEKMGDGWASYGLSKVTLNGLTRKLADALEGRGISVNSVSPGWVRTEMGLMGGAGPDRSVGQGAAGLVWLATEAPHDQTGRFFQDKNEMPW